MEQLLKTGVIVNSQDEAFNTLLYLAVRSGPRMIMRLPSYSSNLWIFHPSGQTALHKALSLTLHTQVKSALEYLEQYLCQHDQFKRQYCTIPSGKSYPPSYHYGRPGDYREGPSIGGVVAQCGRKYSITEFRRQTALD